MTAGPARRIRRIRIESGALKMGYRASAEQAAHVAEALANGHGMADLVVTIDDDVDENLPPLPCGTLWD
ncbi:hypothetical protein [Nocardia sp. CNY236]|uniref:hypothetical protein n=1 Tax=Nocardia sp. CNY236 TaxID=1169152 RepID=UPI000490BB60|nr:hypothetical protein [Nocardia sp. CNY236]